MEVQVHSYHHYRHGMLHCQLGSVYLQCLRAKDPQTCSFTSKLPFSVVEARVVDSFQRLISLLSNPLPISLALCEPIFKVRQAFRVQLIPKLEPR